MVPTNFSSHYELLLQTELPLGILAVAYMTARCHWYCNMTTFALSTKPWAMNVDVQSRTVTGTLKAVIRHVPFRNIKH